MAVAREVGVGRGRGGGRDLLEVPLSVLACRSVEQTRSDFTLAFSCARVELVRRERECVCL